MTTTLIIPAYNEEERLPRFLDDLVRLRRNAPDILTEILLVDDGSTDNTASVAERARDRLPNLRVIRQPRNIGKGRAVQRGVREARSDAMVFMDADGATEASELPKLLNLLRRHPIVSGHRWMAGSSVRGQTPLRSLSSRIIMATMSLFGLGDVDTMCGFKGFRRNVAERLFSPLLEPRWLFDQEVLFRARLLGIPIVSVPITWTSKRGSKVRLSTLVTSAIALPLLLFRVWRRTRT